jgi:hypothetical protein
MKEMKILISAILVVLIAVSAASADGTIDVVSTAAKDPSTGAYLLTVGTDSYAAWNLSAVYSGWTLPANYTVQIREGYYNLVGTVVYETPYTSMITPSFPVELHWVPTSETVGKNYTVWASGEAVGTFALKAQATKPVPEMSTAILMSAGLIGLVGLTRYRKKE